MALTTTDTIDGENEVSLLLELLPKWGEVRVDAVDEREEHLEQITHVALTDLQPVIVDKGLVNFRQTHRLGRALLTHVRHHIQAAFPLTDRRYGRLLARPQQHTPVRAPSCCHALTFNVISFRPASVCRRLVRF